MGLIDAQELGRCIKAARAMAGIISRSDLAEKLNQIGVETSEASVTRYERGDIIPSYEFVAGVLTVCRPHGGWEFFSQRSVREPVRASAESSRISRDSRASLKRRIARLAPTLPTAA